MRWAWMVVAIVAVLLVPWPAYAWGPFTHLLLGRTILSDPGLLPPGLGQLISGFAVDFLYGNLAADFTIAKNLASNLRHAHHWRNALELFRNAEADGQRSFALGYLSHLAADTVAHNYFVPLKMVESYASQLHRHTYWEARFDDGVREQVGSLDLHLMRGRFPDNDALQASHIPGTIFSFRTNRFLFTSAFRVQQLRPWHSTVELLTRGSSTALTRREHQEALDLSLASIRELFVRLPRGEVLAADPRGSLALTRAGHLRRELRLALPRPERGPRRLRLIRSYLRPSFRSALDGPWELPNLVPLLAMLRKI